MIAPVASDGNMMNVHPFHVEYPPNMSGRDFVVGDIHGYFDELTVLLAHHEFRRDRDRLFSVGDLIDRGLNSVEVLHLSQEPWFLPVRGNHEQLMLDGVSSGEFTNWILNGGDWCLEIVEDALKEMARSVGEWPLAITINHRSGRRVGICHAQPPVDHWSKISAVEADPHSCHELLWSRSRALNRDIRPVEGIDWIFCGHTPMERPTMLGNVMFIDTGVFLTDGQLTMLNLDSFLESA